MSPSFAPPPSLRAAALEGYVKAYGASVQQLDSLLAAAPAPAGLIDLTHGDTRAFVPPAVAVADFLAAVTENTEAYTPYRGSSSLRSRLAPRLGTLLGRSVDPADELIVTPGTQGGLFAALSALVSPGDRVALPDPEYYMNERIVAFVGADPVRLPLQQDSQGQLSIAEGDLNVANTAHARLLLLSHPNNPTGGVYHPATLDALARFAVEQDLMVIVDEMYCRMLLSDAPYRHLGSLPGMRERTVTLVGPSKTESMSGYRVGVAVGPAPAIDAMERVLSLACLRTSGYGQQTLRHWMDGDGEWLEDVIEAHRELRDLIVERLAAIPGVRVASPAGSSYVYPLVEGGRWARDDEGANDHELAVALKAAGVLIVPGYRFGPSNRGRFRINFSQDKERLIIAGERIAKVVG